MFTLTLLFGYGFLISWCNVAHSKGHRKGHKDYDEEEEEFNFDHWIETTKPSTSAGVILPSLVIGLIVVAGLVLLFKSGVLCSSAKKPPPAAAVNAEGKVGGGEGVEGDEEGPEEQINLILCHEDKAKFEYVLILRVGCPTPNFDMKKGYIDLDLLDRQDDLLGNQVRFKCSLLKDPICGEMHMLIGSLKPLSSSGRNRISGIRISHGDPFGSIFLYEYVLVNAADDAIIEVRRFNTYITRRHVIYRGVPVEDFDDRNEAEGMNFPELPQVLLTSFEALVIVSLVIILAGSLVMAFEYYNWYPVNQQQDGSLFRSLLDVLFITVILSPLGMIVLIFKFYIKKNLLMHEYSLNEEEANVQHWRCLSQTALGFMTTTTLALSAIIVIYGRQISFTKSTYWFSSTLIISTLLVGTWLTLNDWIWFLSFFENESQVVVAAMLDRKRESAMRRFYASHSRTRKMRNKTIFFSQRFTRRIPTRSSSNARSIGPKLVNPRLMNNKRKQAKQTTKGGGAKVPKMTLSKDPKTVSSQGKKVVKSTQKSKQQQHPLSSSKRSNKQLATAKFKKSTSNKGKSKSTSKNSRRKPGSSQADTHSKLLKS